MYVFSGLAFLSVCEFNISDLLPRLTILHETIEKKTVLRICEGIAVVAIDIILHIKRIISNFKTDDLIRGVAQQYNIIMYKTCDKPLRHSTLNKPSSTKYRSKKYSSSHE